jgi:hypothetical protein
MEALGGQRRVQSLGDALGGGGGIETRRAVPEIEGEGVGREAGGGPHLYRARIAHCLGGFLKHGLQAVNELSVGDDDQARRGLDLAGERLQGGLDGGLREGVEGGGGDGSRAGQRQLR